VGVIKGNVTFTTVEEKTTATIAIAEQWSPLEPPGGIAILLNLFEK
jgi:hypothetical protein